MKQEYKMIKIGIDEVGRGPIAGPVCVAAFVYFRNAFKDRPWESKKDGPFLKLRDSKKLSKKQREEWFEIIKKWKKEKLVDYSYHMISAKQIDKIGISKAIKICVDKCLEKLGAGVDYEILLDGSLYAPQKYKNQKTIIKGDEKISVISLASIVAKVTRDSYMQKMSKKFPNYGFENHVGYGTLAHYSAIKKYGITEIHRKSYLKNVKYVIN